MTEIPYAIVTPCFNEEQSVIIFLQRVEASLAEAGKPFHVIVVDDSSEDASLALLKDFRFNSPLFRLTVLKLKFNVGHQLAIYQGLLYASRLDTKNIIIMDSDGEDDPNAILQVLGMDNYDIVEIKRGKRSEDFSFRLAYRFYKWIFHIITGKNMDYGNYCMISRGIVDRIAHTGFLHLPAYLLKQKGRRAYITYDRGKRIRGESKLGMKGLLIHAFKSFIEFGEDLLLLFLKLFILISIVLVLIVGNLVYQKFFAGTAIPGWFSTVAMELVILAVICLGFFIIGILLLNLIHQQNNRDHQNIYTVVKSES
ncbi:MAG: glycosyltransferase [Bacteroidetes bacterium]|nr:glycosyltransferase [Bacteroidota bacterium]